MNVAFRLKNGSLMLSTEAPGGIYNSSQLKAIAALCEEDSAIVKVTEDQRLALFVDEDRAEEIASRLKKMGLGIRHYRNGLHQPTSCIGALCPDHKQDAQGSAMAVTEILASIELDNPLRIGINGCSTCCVPCHTLDISVMGDDSGYRICIGGKSTQIAEMAQYIAEGVPVKELPKMLRKIVEIYKKSAVGAETLQDLIERAGPSQFISALAPYSQDAVGGTDPFSMPAEKSEAIDEISDIAANEIGVDLIAEDDFPLESLEAESDGPLAFASEADDDFGELKVMDENPDEFGGDLDINPAEFSGSDQELGSEVPIVSAGLEFDTLDDDFASNDHKGIESNSLEDDLPIMIGEDSIDDFAVDSLEGMEVEDELPIVTEDFEADDLSVSDSDEFGIEDKALAIDEGMDPLEMESESVDASSDFADSTLEDSLTDEFAESAAIASDEDLETETSPISEIEDDSTSELEAKEGTEEDESAFEKKFDEDMIDTETFAAAVDKNSGARNEAIRLVEDAEASIVDEGGEGDGDESEVLMDDVEDLGFDDSADEAPAAVVKAMPSPIKKLVGRANWILTAIRNEDTAIVLEFNSGAHVHFNPSTVKANEERIISIGGKSLCVKNDGSSISVETDGITLVLPKQVA